MPKEITFKIHPGGRVEIEVDGVEDASCEQITKAFEEALGIKVDTQFKPEYWNAHRGTEVKVSN